MVLEGLPKVVLPSLAEKLLRKRECDVPQTQYNLAQIDMMVRTIHSLKNEAVQIDSTHSSEIEPKAEIPVPQLIITSRPRAKNANQTPENENKHASLQTRHNSADIIDIMDRIAALAADSELANTPVSPDESIPNIGALLSRIHGLFEEANQADISLDHNKPNHKNTDIVSDLDPTLDESYAAELQTSPEPHKLDDNPLEAEEVDAAMQDIETAVRNATPLSVETTQTASETAISEQARSDTSSGDAIISENLTGMIRDEVRTVIKNELPDAVRSIVRQTLRDEGYTPPQREKIRTRRFRNT